MNLSTIISGGQFGADLAAWQAARRHGITPAGWMPHGFLAETPSGIGHESHPEYAALYNAREHPSSGYPERRRANLADSDGAIVFNVGPDYSRGTRGLLNDRALIRKPVRVIAVAPREGPEFCVSPERKTFSDPEIVADWIGRQEIRKLMVAGNRESAHPGIGRWIGEYLDVLFLILERQ